MQIALALTDRYCVEHDHTLRDAPAEHQTCNVELFHACSEDYEACDVKPFETVENDPW